MARDKVIRDNPELWEKLVSKYKDTSKYGGFGWNARKAQLAVKEYKKLGGGYLGNKDKNNSLVRWTRQDWGYSGKEKESRYLPREVRRKLSRGERAATNRSKKRAINEGRKKAPYSSRIKSYFRDLK